MGNKPIPVYVPYLSGYENEKVSKVLASRWLTQGPEVAAFENEFSNYIGSSYSCAVSNCTTALFLALKAIGVGNGDEVLTVSHSFIATANSIRYCGATPVFVDIDPHTFNIDPGLVDEAITSKTKAILVVHQMGMPCDLDAILALAKKKGLLVVEDAACAVGSEIKNQNSWEKIGRPHGDLTCFSFHPRKLLTTGEGGMITTNSEELSRKIKSLRHHGMSMSDLERHSSSKVVFETYPCVGYNFRLSDLQAAVGREQLRILPEIIIRRRKQVEFYRELFDGIDSVELPIEPSWAKSNWQSFCLRIKRNIGQKELMQKALDQGISLRRGVMCSHLEGAYDSGEWKVGRSGLLKSEEAQDRCVLIPLFHEITESDQERVASFFREI